MWLTCAKVACLAVVALVIPAGAGAHPAHSRPARGPAHVQTWAVDDGCNGGMGASPALVRRWLTYAETNCGPRARKARADCHQGRRIRCRVMQYLDTDWQYPAAGVPVARVASDGWWLHEPSGAGISSSATGGGQLINQTDGAARAFFRGYARRHYDRDDGLLMDWQSPSLSQELYYSTCGCRTTREIHTNTALRAAHDQMAAALTHRDGRPFLQVDNTLSPNPYLPQGFDMLDRRTGVDAFMVEGAPESAGVMDPYYSTLLDQIARITRRTRAFVVLMSAGDAGAATEARSRRVQEATILLGYRPGRVVDWADLERGSRNLAVWPEEGIYPTHPLQSMRAPGGRGCLAGRGVVCARGGHNSVRVAPGVYRREFGACYRNG
ncbi:MAG: hypothetical protein ACRDLV_14695, partial [Solirubrobacteraceae bacterium]